jgi:hypothetical protein
MASRSAGNAKAERKIGAPCSLSRDNGTRVLYAESKDAASGLAQYTVFDIRSA